MQKLSQYKVDQIVGLAHLPETEIAKQAGVSRWTVHHYLELAGMAKTYLNRNWSKPPPGNVVRKGTFTIYYNKMTAKLGYPWVVEWAGWPDKTTLAKEIDVIGPMMDFQDRVAWTSFDPRPNPKLTERPSYVRGVLMVRGVILVKN